jgi:uncharacterized RDD family membrane protein YckC
MRLEPGVQVCPSCGARRPSPVSNQRRPEPIAEAEPDSLTDAPDSLAAPEAAPACQTHPGAPTVGHCPQCGRPVCARCAPGASSGQLACTDCLSLRSAPGVVPSGARCAVHEDRPARLICARCGSFACAACAVGPRPTLCSRCAPEALPPLASQGQRLVAHLIDSVVFVAPVGVMVAVSASAEDSDGGVWALFALVSLALGVGALAAQLWAQLHWGQSLGKRLQGIKVVRTDGSPIELWRLVLLRNFAIQALSQLGGLIGFIDALMIFRQDQRCLHDHFAGTIVVQAPRR